MQLTGRRILLGVCGGIAAYKSALLARALIRAGASVRVAMTASGQRFVAPLTFEALTEQTCLTDDDLFHTGGGVSHVEIARTSDLILVAPATATTLARLAGGFADNLLSAVVLASRAPVLLVPSMHTAMWEAVPVQRNLGLLDPARYRVMRPASGDLASGDCGPGRFPEPDDIVDAAAAALAPQDLAGRRVVVTAGPTREHLDPVRMLTNPSTGRMGIEVARSAQIRGAHVHLILGPTEVPPPRALDTNRLVVTRVVSTADMLAATRAALVEADALVMAAAPADERPARSAAGKVRKEDLPTTLALEPTPDILKTLRAEPGRRVVVGFAAETEDIEVSGRRKMADKGLDLLFANPVDGGRGFGVAVNEGILLGPDGRSETVSTRSKAAVADLLLDRLVALLSSHAEASGKG
jgi:phosphopantothenoylcysteine decarboxylase/phosphopantothenate--cysteine ligase